MLRSTPLNVQASRADCSASWRVRYDVLGVPSRVKCDATRPRGRVGGGVRFLRGIAQNVSDLYSLGVSTDGQTELLVHEVIETDEGDHERFTHVVLEGFTPKDGDFVALENSVVEGMINATPVRALCGKVWVPGRDPQRYPLCPTCREIASSMGWSLPAG